MSAQLLKGKPLSDALRRELGARARKLTEERGTPPRLAIIAIGGDPGSQVYLRKKLEACREVGIESTLESLPSSITESKVWRLISKLGADPDVDGIIVDMPVPDPLDAARLVEAIPAEKDVEGVTAQNLGRLYAQKSWEGIKKAEVLVPCTANAIVHLLLEAKVPPAGRHAVVVGRSTIVGRPTAHLLSALDATVTLAHSRTKDLERYIKDADILVCALGKAGAVKGSWVKPGAVVADAGINSEGGRLVGDLEAGPAAERAAWLTPVPGGVGPLTVTFLLYNTVLAAERRTRKTLG